MEFTQASGGAPLRPPVRPGRPAGAGGRRGGEPPPQNGSEMLSVRLALAQWLRDKLL